MTINKIIIILGEPNSIFLEILFKFFKSKKFNYLKKKIILIGSYDLSINQMKKLNYNFKFNIINKIDESKKNKINIINVDYHFKKESLIDEFNFEDHYTEEHMERQRALEAYGYKFIRLNRFNCSDDPITFLSKALFDACKNDDTNTIRQRIIKTAKSIASKNSRYCKTCEKVKEL